MDIPPPPGQDVILQKPWFTHKGDSAFGRQQSSEAAWHRDSKCGGLNPDSSLGCSLALQPCISFFICDLGIKILLTSQVF